MPRLALRLVASALLSTGLSVAIAACGGDDSTAPPLDLGTCVGSCSYNGTESAGPGSMAQGGYCRAYTGSAWTQTNTSSTCPLDQGSYIFHCCGVDDALGMCIVGKGTANEWKDVYYGSKGWTTATAQEACKTTNGGVGNEYVAAQVAVSN